MRRLLALLLACVVAAAGLPAPAFAASRSVDGEIGMRVGVEADATFHKEGGEVGVRVTVASAEGAGHAEGGTIGVRVSLPSAEARGHIEAGGIGVRVSLPSAEAREHREGGTIGVRVTVPSEAAARHVEAGTVGVRVSSSFSDTYTVSFDTRGGSTIADVRVESGGAVAEPAEPPTRKGYAFTGWYETAAAAEANAGNTYPFARPVVSDVVLYAGWVEQIDVTFHANGGTVSVAAGAAWGGWSQGEDGGLQRTATNCRADVTYAEYFPECFGDAFGLEPPADARSELVFAGWWTGNGSADGDADAGAWGRRIQAADAVGAAATDIWARWEPRSYTIVVHDPAGGTTGWGEAALELGGALPEASALWAADELPHRTGYALAGLWGGGEDAVKYYEADGDRLVVADAFADGAAWELAEHKSWNPEASGGGRWEVVLEARWSAMLVASLPVSLTFAIGGMSDERPSVTAPSADAFAISSRTPVDVRVEAVEAVGLAGMSDVFWTREVDGERTLDWSALGGETLSLTLTPAGATGDAGAAGDAVSLAIADEDGLAGAGESACALPATDAWRIGAWAGAADDPSKLHIAFGLQLPEPIRAAQSATGEIARVTFTVGMQA